MLFFNLSSSVLTIVSKFQLLQTDPRDALHHAHRAVHKVGTLPWQPIVASKLAKPAYSPLFVALELRRNGLQYRAFDFKRFISGDLATSTKKHRHSHRYRHTDSVNGLQLILR